MQDVTRPESELFQAVAPDWEVLELAVGPELLPWFHWMHESVLADGTAVHTYKHETTRRVLHLARGPRAMLLDGGEVRAVPLRTALTEVFVGWHRAQPSAVEIRRLRAAIEQARSGLLSD